MLLDNFLAVDTSTTSCSILLILDGQRYHYALHGQLAHAEQFYTWLNELNQQHPDFFKKLKLLGLCIGPGRFNGLRVGITMISTLMTIYGLPVHICTSHQLLAAQAVITNPEGYAIFAKYGYAYWCDREHFLEPRLISVTDIPSSSVVFGLDAISALEHHEVLDIIHIENLISNKQTQIKNHYADVELLYVANMV